MCRSQGCAVFAEAADAWAQRLAASKRELPAVPGQHQGAVLAAPCPTPDTSQQTAAIFLSARPAAVPQRLPQFR